MELLEAGFAVVVVDNLVNAKPESLLRYLTHTHTHTAATHALCRARRGTTNNSKP